MSLCYRDILLSVLRAIFKVIFICIGLEVLRKKSLSKPVDTSMIHCTTAVKQIKAFALSNVKNTCSSSYKRCLNSLFDINQFFILGCVRVTLGVVLYVLLISVALFSSFKNKLVCQKLASLNLKQLQFPVDLCEMSSLKLLLETAKCETYNLALL